MEKVMGFLLEKMWPVICESVRDARLLIQSTSSFFDEMKKRKEICSRAWLFGVAVAIGLSTLGLPASRSAGIVPSFEFASVMTLTNWLLIALYGVCFGFAARLLGAHNKILASANTFFYLSGWLFLLKLFEMPALGSRLKAMAQSCTAIGYGEAVSSAIQKSAMALMSNFLVFIGYAVFTLLIFKMYRSVHEFGRARALLATVIGMLFLSIAISYVQGPAISQLVCGYVGHS
jgi:hypothetical protein